MKKQGESRSFLMPKSTEYRLLSIGDDRERKNHRDHYINRYQAKTISWQENWSLGP